MEDVMHAPIPCMCSGIITSDIRDDFTYEVSVYNTPLGELGGPAYAKSLYQPGGDGNYKQGDEVQLLISFIFGGTENRFLGINNNHTNYILGLFNERVVANIEVDNPNSENSPDKIRFIHRDSGAGITASSSGKTVISSGGSIFSLLNPFGFGVNENSHRTVAQNHQRLISDNQPLYLSREFFGMFAGASLDDRIDYVKPDDFPINFRRFVTQTKSPDNWVGTCEGAWAPWVGANNNTTDKMEIEKEVLFTKAVNHGSSRLTIEAGEPGDSFVNVRVDDVIKSESKSALGSGANPAIVGNRFKMGISDQGALDIRAGGKGLPGTNTNTFHMEVDADGNMKIHASGTIELSHGDNDAGINSIKLDPKKGVDIVAKNGFRVNGTPLVNENFLDWMIKYQTQLCLVTSIGGPAPIHPVALPEFVTGTESINDLSGFTTKNKGAPASKLISDSDRFDTV